MIYYYIGAKEINKNFGLFSFIQLKTKVRVGDIVMHKQR